MQNRQRKLLRFMAGGWQKGASLSLNIYLQNSKLRQVYKFQTQPPPNPVKKDITYPVPSRVNGIID